MKIRLPDKNNIFKTGLTDPICWHYHPLISFFMIKRLKMTLSLLGERKFNKILDAGYGGGIFMPELFRKCNELYGIDIHDKSQYVQLMLEKEDIKAILMQSDVTKIDFPDETFDCVVCISVLEFIADLEKAIDELHRVTRTDGIVIIGFPIEKPYFRLLYLAIGVDSKKVHASTYRDIIRELKEKFILKRTIRFPQFLPLSWSLFTCFELYKK